MSSEYYKEQVVDLLNTAAEARDDALMERAKLELCSDIESTVSLDTMLALEITATAGRIRDLGKSTLKNTFMNRRVPKPTMSEEAGVAFLQLRDVCTTPVEYVAEAEMIDGFTVYVPQDHHPTKEAIFMLREVSDLETNTRRNVGSIGIVVDRKDENEPNLIVQNIEQPKSILDRAVSAMSTFNEYAEKYPWLSAFHVATSPNGVGFEVSMKLDGQLSTLQTLVGGDPSERHSVLYEVNKAINSWNFRQYDEQESKYMALGILMSLRKQLKIK